MFPVDPVTIIIFVVVVLVSMSLRIVKEYDRGVIFFLGKVTGVRGPGLIILIPILEQMTKVTLRTITMNIPRICSVRWPRRQRPNANAVPRLLQQKGEFQAEVKLGAAADIIALHPVALQLRTLQTMAEISIERNSTIIFPAQFMTTVQEAISAIRQDTSNK